MIILYCRETAFSQSGETLFQNAGKTERKRDRVRFLKRDTDIPVSEALVHNGPGSCSLEIRGDASHCNREYNLLWPF